MKRLAIAALLFGSWLLAFAGSKAPGAAATAAPVVSTVKPQERSSQFEGEQRFRTNCGRCHQAPHKFPPRMMATIIRHMRVRATLTDEDMKSILSYMTE